jgi:hypothetical protein
MDMANTKQATHFLTIGTVYDVELALTLHEGWTYGDGSGHEGYHVEHYFDKDGCYLGADDYDIEPLFSDYRLLEVK